MVFGPAFFYVRFCHSDHSACLLISCAENATMQHGGPHYEGLLRFFYVICITALGTVTFVFLVTNIIFPELLIDTCWIQPSLQKECFGQIARWPGWIQSFPSFPSLSISVILHSLPCLSTLTIPTRYISVMILFTLNVINNKISLYCCQILIYLTKHYF